MSDVLPPASDPGPFAPPGPRPPARVDGRGIAAGVALTLGLHVGAGVVIALLGFLLASISEDLAAPLAIAAAAPGLVQVLWMAPAYITARRRGALGVAVGLLLGAASTFLLNAGCWGLVFGIGGIH